MKKAVTLVLLLLVGASMNCMEPSAVAPQAGASPQRSATPKKEFDEATFAELQREFSEEFATKNEAERRAFLKKVEELPSKIHKCKRFKDQVRDALNEMPLVIARPEVASEKTAPKAEAEIKAHNDGFEETLEESLRQLEIEGQQRAEETLRKAQEEALKKQKEAEERKQKEAQEAAQALARQQEEEAARQAALIQEQEKTRLQNEINEAVGRIKTLLNKCGEQLATPYSIERLSSEELERYKADRALLEVFKEGKDIMPKILIFEEHPVGKFVLGLITREQFVAAAKAFASKKAAEVAGGMASSNATDSAVIAAPTKPTVTEIEKRKGARDGGLGDGGGKRAGSVLRKVLTLGALAGIAYVGYRWYNSRKKVS